MLKLDRAYSMLTVKAVDDEQRIITGIATTPTPDRMNDIVDPMGVKFKNPMPLLWQHRSSEPVGKVRFSKPTKSGISFEARMPKIEEPGKLKDRVDEAWQSVKLGLVSAVSIGFRPIEQSFMDNGGIHFISSEVLELSLVTIPAQADAVIETIKAIDARSLKEELESEDISAQQAVAASGKAAASATPGVTGRVKPNKDIAIMAKKTYGEQIAEHEAKRAAKVARMEEIMSKAGDESTTLDGEQKDEYDLLEQEVKAIDDHLVRLHNLENLNRKAVVAVADTQQQVAVQRTAGPVVSVRQVKLLPGIPFTRMVGALAQAKGNRFEAAEIAKRWGDTSPEVEQVLRIPFDLIERTAVTVGTTTGTTNAEPLVQYQVLANEFIEFLRPLTIIGRIPGFRRVPFKIKVPRATAGASVNWVGEAKVKPLSSLAFDSLTLDFFKIAGIIPLSEELIRFSTPSAEQLVRDDLAAAIVSLMDTDFVDPTKALAATVSPASITNGVTAVAATGTNAAAFRADAKTMMSTILAAGIPVSSGVWIMKQGRALSLSLMMNALGQPEFPNISMSGGTLLGFPVITSENVTATGGSPVNGDNIIFALANEILLADDGGVTIDVSREASLQMDTTPDSPVATTTILVSLWQHNMVAIKAERYINWLKRRAQAVQYISYAKYA